MTRRKYGRVWELQAGIPGGSATIYTGMDISFRAVQSSKGANLCDVSFWMPDDPLVEALNRKDTRFRVLAGYKDGGVVEVAQGAVVRDSVRDKRSASEPVISWQLSPSSRAIARAVVSMAWGPVHASVVIEHIRKALGIPADIIKLPVDYFYACGHAIEKPETALAEVVRDCDAQHSIIDNRLRIWAIDGVAKRTAEVWSEANGTLLESAAPNGDGKVTARALLSPGRRPGDTVRIVGRAWSGDIRGQEFVHTGNSAAQVWETSVTGVVGG